MTPTLLAWLSLAAWPTGEQLPKLQQHAIDVLIQKAVQGTAGRLPPTWDELEAQRLRALDVNLRCRERTLETLDLLETALTLIDSPKSVQYYKMKQELLRNQLRELDERIRDLQQQEPKRP